MKRHDVADYFFALLLMACSVVSAAVYAVCQETGWMISAAGWLVALMGHSESVEYRKLFASILETL